MGTGNQQPPVIDDQEGLATRIVDAFKAGMQGRSDSILSNVPAMAYKQSSELFSRHEEMVNVFGRGNDTFNNMYAGVKEMQSNFYSMATDSGTALSTIFDDQGDLIKEYQGIVSSNLLQIHTTTEAVTAKEMADLTLYRRALDFSSDQTQKFMERQFALTGEASNELLKQTLAYANAIEAKTDISSKIIAENVAGMMTDIRTFGNMTVEEMSEAAAAIAKVGLQVDDLGGLVKKFSTFEGAADSVSKLTQVFGVQMDTMKYMTASFESPQDMLAMIQEDFEAAGVDMANMDMAQKRLLADTTGMSISAVESLLGEAGSTLSDFTVDVSGATAGVGETEISGALAAAGDDIAVINQMYDSVETAARRSGERTARAISGVFSEEMRVVGREAEMMVGDGIRVASSGAHALEGEAEEAVRRLMDEIKRLGRSARRSTAGAAGRVEGSEDISDFLNQVFSGNVNVVNSEEGRATGTTSSVASPVITRDDSSLVESIDAAAVPGTSRGGVGTISTVAGEDMGALRVRLEALQRETAAGAFTPEMLEQVLTAWKEEQDKTPELQPINLTITDSGEAWNIHAERAGVILPTSL